MTPASPEIKFYPNPDPAAQGRDFVESVVKKAQDAAKNEDQIREAVTNEVNKDIMTRTSSAQKLRNAYEKKTSGENVSGNEQVNIEKSVQAFVEALENNRINLPSRPPHMPTQVVLDNLKDTLRGHVDSASAPYLQPLINGILNVSDYIDPTPGSQFDTDLNKILSGSKEFNDYIHEVLFNPARPLPFTTAQIQDLENRFAQVSGEKIRETTKETKKKDRSRGQFSEQEDDFLLKKLDMPADSPDFELAEEIRDGLLENLGTAEEFFDYYREKYIKKLKDSKYEDELRKASVDMVTLDTVPSGALERIPKDLYKKISDDLLKNVPPNILEEVQRDTTMELHQMFQFLVHRIFSDVIEKAGHGEWKTMVQEAKQGWINPDNVFKRVLSKLSALGNKTPLFDKNTVKENFYQLGIEKVTTAEAAEVELPDGTKEIKYFAPNTVEILTSDLEKVDGFKEFFERFNTAMSAEEEFLEVGVNSVFLMHHGAHDGSFFENFAKYGEKLSNQLLDELYRLPNADIIHALRMAQSSQYKRDLARNRWQVRPNMFSGLFHHADSGQHHVLLNMIRSNLTPEIPPDTTPEEKKRLIGNARPEWAIRRALIHARMHMALVSVEFHALAGYAHPPLKDKLDASYMDSDPVFANLETFRTWFEAKKWATSELQRYGMAFYPAPNRKWSHDIWLPDDVKADGKKAWIDSNEIGSLSLYQRSYVRPDTPLNISELNPMGVNGVERMSGWGLKYPYISWIEQLIDFPTSRENFHLKHQGKNERGEIVQDYRDFEIGWKSLENLGIEILNNYKENFLFGYNDKFMKLEGNGKVKAEKHYEVFFKFLYDRYFKTGVGKESLGISFRDYRQQGLPEVSFQYSQFNSSKDFWEKVVEPILNRPDVYGEGEKKSFGEARNQKERMGLLKHVVEQALGVIMFERLPMEMTYTEDPLISQNGMTLIEEIARDFERVNSPGTDHHDKHPDDGKMTTYEFEHALADLENVQAMARLETIRLMKETTKNQRREPFKDTDDKPNTFGKTVKDIYNLRSNIVFSKKAQESQDGQPALSPTGYVIDEHIIKDLLTASYERRWDSKSDSHLQPDLDHFHPDLSQLPADASDEQKNQEVERQKQQETLRQRNEVIKSHVNNAVSIYKAIRKKMATKPLESFGEKYVHDKNVYDLVDNDWAARAIKYEKERGDLEEYEKTPEILEERKARIREGLRRDFDENRRNSMKTRLAWSSEHLLDPKMPIPINDMAYNFVYFSSTGSKLVQRRLAQIADTQEYYKNYIMGEYDSDMKKYYRKEDFSVLLKNIIGVRSKAKAWVTDDVYNGIATFILENSINVMRIRSDAENAFVEFQYRMEHKSRAGISPVATEGTEFPLRRQDRSHLRIDFAHDGQTPKRAKDEDKVYKVVENVRRTKITNFTGTFGTTGINVGEAIASVADMLLGEDEAGIIRDEIAETSTDAGRLRDFSSIFHILTREGPTIIVLLLAALMVLSVVQGYRASEEK